MAHDVVWLADQFGFSKAADLQKILVDVGNLALQIGLRDDQAVVAQLNFLVADRQIGAHGGSPWGSVQTKVIYSKRNKAAGSAATGHQPVRSWECRR